MTPSSFLCGGYCLWSLDIPGGLAKEGVRASWYLSFLVALAASHLSSFSNSSILGLQLVTGTHVAWKSRAATSLAYDEIRLGTRMHNRHPLWKLQKDLPKPMEHVFLASYPPKTRDSQHTCIYPYVDNSIRLLPLRAEMRGGGCIYPRRGQDVGT